MRYFLLVLVAVVMVGCVATAQADTAPFAQVSSSLTQPVATTPTQALIDTVDAAQGIVLVGNELIVPEYGVLFVMHGPQVGNLSDEYRNFEAWLRINGEDVPNSNVMLRLDPETADVIPMQGAVPVEAGDALSFWVRASGEGVILEAIEPEGAPRIPAHITTAFYLP
jgi:hypothetical protein